METVWILNHYATTPAQGGGTRHYNFAKELVDRGYRVFIFASSFMHESGENLLAPGEKTREVDVDGIHWIWMNTKGYRGNGVDRFLGMIDYYRKMISIYSSYAKPDYVIGSAVHLMACAAGIKISKLTGAKCISEVRDLWPQTLIDMGKLDQNSILAKILYKLEKYVYQNSERIIVTVSGMADYMKGIGIDESKIYYINNGVDVKAFDELKDNEDASAAERILDENHGKFKCIYAGAIGEANYIDNLLDAAKIIQEKNMKEIQFVIVGDGTEKNRLSELCRSQNMENLRFYGFIRKDMVPRLLNSADINIFNLKKIDVLKYGLSSNKLFDYLCSGKPVVFACNAGSDFVTESGAGISVEPEDPEALSEAIIKIFNMTKEEQLEMGLKGRKFVEDHFDIPILVDRLEEVFHQ